MGLNIAYLSIDVLPKFTLSFYFTKLPFVQNSVVQFMHWRSMRI